MLQAMMRPEVLRLTPYVPIKPLHVLSAELGLPIEALNKLDANESPYGPSPQALAALRALRLEIPIYPDPDSLDLRGALAEKLGVTSEMVVVGAGADELIELLFKLFINPGEAIINCPPTFGMYTFCAAVAGAREVVVERDADYRLDTAAIEAAILREGAKLVFISAPNNPDGSYLPPDLLPRLLALPVMVVLDEAYVAFTAPDLAGEFGPENTARLVADHPNLAVLRTFSKWGGMAGLRCGYGIFAPEVARYLMSIKQPYNINVAARAAALATLEDIDWARQRVNWMIQARARLYEQLAQFEQLAPLPDSQGNFILAEVRGRSALEVKQALQARGVLVRHFAKPRLENHIRISLGTPAQMDQFISILGEVLS
jgi:histidinol-phosphate aminotransferase